MGKVTPSITCHLWESLNHHGHSYRRGDQQVHCPGRNRPGVPWVSTKRNKAEERAEVVAAWLSQNSS